MLLYTCNNAEQVVNDIVAPVEFPANCNRFQIVESSR